MANNSRSLTVILHIQKAKSQVQMWEDLIIMAGRTGNKTDLAAVKKANKALSAAITLLETCTGEIRNQSKIT